MALDAHQLGTSTTQRPSNPVATALNSVIPYTIPTNILPQAIYAPPPPVIPTEHTNLTPRPITMPPYGSLHRMSEGSSCSDADGSLKRSKRQRRPNKFYGYTSDDENPH
ncbi:hypothetical protein EVAR_70651_1 [Eumeta japonica]|uniref:Uncharacterized protein n=1 Tax=Eumeta variegata TaxID=151549 RepID=A0A4C1SDH5_EUMVA|nr:hypothetical protein EVAR_70651_1 [Eumeta japonica]